MSVTRFQTCRVRWRWCFPVIPWYRQVLALVFGLGVMLIALWAIENGTGRVLIMSVAGMAFLTLLLIFGVEVDSVEVGALGLTVDFTNTGVTRSVTERRDDSDDD